MTTYTSSDLLPWLGDAAGGLTPEQLDHFTTLVNRYDTEIVARRHDYGTDDYEPADYQEETDAAWVAALEIAEGGIDLALLGSRYDDARTRAQQAAIMAVLDGTSENEAATLTRYSRPTLRKALGK